jgi:hypothetical protein
MDNHRHNRLRQLQGLVTIDAWHEGHPHSGQVDLHAYVYFDEARLGGQAGDEVAFRLQLRKAEIKLLQSEPKSFSIDTANVWRGDSDPSGRITQTTERVNARASDRNASIFVKASPELSLVGGGKSSNSLTEKTEVQSDRSTKTIKVSFKRNDIDQPTWVLHPDVNSPKIDELQVLSGQPWDDKTQRLLIMYVDKGHENKQMLSSLRLCLICRSEDLYFYDIATRTLGGEFQSIPDTSTKKLIVQEYLRKALLSEGLHAGDMNSPFSFIYLGEAISEQRRINEGE